MNGSMKAVIESGPEQSRTPDMRTVTTSSEGKTNSHKFYRPTIRTVVVDDHVGIFFSFTLDFTYRHRHRQPPSLSHKDHKDKNEKKKRAKERATERKNRRNRFVRDYNIKIPNRFNEATVATDRISSHEERLQDTQQNYKPQ
jgi:hypothetical protein